VSIVKLPRSAIVALALPLAFSIPVRAETGDAAQGSYYSDPLFSIDRGVDKPHMRDQDHDLPSASAESTRTVAKETGDGGAKIVMEHATGGCAVARCRAALDYFPDSHVNLDYFPGRSSHGYFPATR